MNVIYTAAKEVFTNSNTLTGPEVAGGEADEGWGSEVSPLLSISCNAYRTKKLPLSTEVVVVCNITS